MNDGGNDEARQNRPQAAFPLILGTLLVAGLLLRLLYGLFIVGEQELTGDPLFYEMSGTALRNGEGYRQPLTYITGERLPTAGFPPGYSSYLALITYLGGDTQLWHRAAGAVLGAMSVGFIGVLGRRIAGATVGLTAAGLAALYPMLFVSDGALLAEVLFLPLLLAAAILSLKVLDRYNPAHAMLLGATLGAATLTRSDGVLFTAALAGYTIIHLGRGADRRRVAALVALTFLALVTPWQIRNLRSFEGPVLLSTNAGTLVAGSNCTETYRGELKGWWSFGCVLAGSDGGLSGLSGSEARSDPDCSRCDEAEFSRRLVRSGLLYARSHTKEIPEVLLVRTARLFGLYDPIDQMRLEANEGRSYRWQVRGWVMYIVLLPLAAAGAHMMRHDRVKLGLLLVLVLHATLVGLLSYGNQRFRIAAEPAIVILSAIAIVRCVRQQRLTHRKDRDLDLSRPGPTF